jgi:hypothetical protein
MKSSELRIRNWVKTATPKMEIMIPHLIAEVQGVKYGEVFFGENYDGEGFSMTTKHIQGIELTQDIIHKCGFEMLYFNPRLDTFYGNKKSYYPFLIQYSRDGVWYFYNEKNCELKYLHQLQNLYFAWTGDELEIDLNS